MTFKLAIVGRPNVGKSTLFNRLVGRRLALVDNQPGVTRDIREGEARLAGVHCTVMDTAGLEEARDESLQGRMRHLTERAISTADACLFMIDARVGVLPDDEALANVLRRKAAAVILVANKSEGRAGEAGLLEAYSLGFGDPLPLSAEHGEGIDELDARLEQLVRKADRNAGMRGAGTHADAVRGNDCARVPAPEFPLKVAVVGRPNAGKSTLVNRLLGEDRLLAGPEAGITRDAISVFLDWDGMPVRVFDTAGMRKKARVQDKLERLSVGDGLRAIKFAEVVIVVLDAAIPFEQQDLRIADLAEREGRAVAIAVNKWDQVTQGQAGLGELSKNFERLLPQLRGAPLVAVSALKGSGMDRLRDAVVRAYDVWNRRVGTAELNRWLAEAIAAHPPPAPGGRRIKLRYITQARTRPPGFVVMCSYPQRLNESYRRYLINALREEFDMPGTPVRLTFRGQGHKNPYRNRKKPSPSRLRKHLDPGPSSGA
ncbi:MAG: ribosome biogenesis GTPase Der [Boseongicola sp. SB0677_bin_26]|nr:ribosome biogenesis GTPase Der [Boseongicola sp. SB0665_bin_10]MYG26030.1 ribosome biogenesis GTPase Der [Boseongicola sp. SB0677_bin_26]